MIRSDLVEQQVQGNAAFSSGDYEKAVDLFSQAIELDASNNVLFSNRSAAKVLLLLTGAAQSSSPVK